MSRPLRIEYSGAYYHVMNRGNRRGVVFHSAEDYRIFLRKLAEFSESYHVLVHCYCLLPSHFHLDICTPEANLSRFMQGLLTSVTTVLNRKHQTSGHLFQGRFKAHLVESERYGDELSRYIHLNPIRVSRHETRPIADKRQLLADYPWSSFAMYVGLRFCPKWLDTGSVLSDWGNSLVDQMKNYRGYV